jgi:UDP-glucose 4-epimerase
MRILIIGAGFIGLNFIRSQLSSNIKISVLDRKRCPDDLKGKVNWIIGDFYSDINLNHIIKDIDIVFYFISNTTPRDTFNQANEVFSITKYTLNLLDLCVTHKIKRFIFTSSASVYGNQVSQPISESSSTNPVSYHGINKLVIEKYIAYYNYQYKLDCKILRISNPFGPGQSFSSSQSFILNLISCILSNKEIILYGDGSAIRDYIYIDDVSSALALSMITTSKLNTFNISSGIGYSLIDVIMKIKGFTKKPVLFKFEPAKPADIKVSILEASAAHNYLGFTCKYNFEDALLLTLKYYKVYINE